MISLECKAISGQRQGYTDGFAGGLRGRRGLRALSARPTMEVRAEPTSLSAPRVVRARGGSEHRRKTPYPSESARAAVLMPRLAPRQSWKILVILTLVGRVTEEGLHFVVPFGKLAGVYAIPTGRRFFIFDPAA
jgi:hypothetical protein